MMESLMEPIVEKLHTQIFQHNCKTLRENVSRVCAAKFKRVQSATVKVCNEVLWKVNYPITRLNQWAVNQYMYTHQSRNEEKEAQETELEIARMDSEGPAMKVVTADLDDAPT